MYVQFSLQMDNRFDSLNTSLQQRPQLLGSHAARLEQFNMRFDDLNRVRVLGNLHFQNLLTQFHENVYICMLNPISHKFDLF